MQTTAGYEPCTSAEPAEAPVVTVIDAATGPSVEQQAAPRGARCGRGKGRPFRKKMKRCCCLLFVVLIVMMGMLSHLVHQTNKIYQTVKDDNDKDYPGGSATAFCSDLCVRMCLHEERAPSCEVLHCRGSCLRSIDEIDNDDDNKDGHGKHHGDHDGHGESHGESHDGHEGHDGHGEGHGSGKGGESEEHEGGSGKGKGRESGEESGEGKGSGKGGEGDRDSGEGKGKGGEEGEEGEGEGKGKGGGEPPKMIGAPKKRRIRKQRLQIGW